MAAVTPFRALRYNPAVVGDLSAVLSPPYDVINPQQQEQLSQASPYNVVRLILGKQYPTDNAEDNRYLRAKRDFGTWRENRILQLDPAPAIYLIEHAFTDEGGRTCSRLGFIALLQLEEPAERMVYRHEATLAAPKEDRTKLLQEVPANLEPIFCVYPDPRGDIQALLRSATQRSAPAAAAAINGEAVTVWPVTDDAVIQHLATHLAPSAVLIADGHHRFEVAYANRSRYGALMSYFVSMAETSLVVRPIHRVVQAGAEDARALGELCRMEPAQDVPAVLRWLKEERGQPEAAGRFGYFDGRTLYAVTLQPNRLAEWMMKPTVPFALAPLDVSLLHHLILPRLGGNSVHGTASAGAGGSSVQYTASASEAVDAAAAGQGRSAWLLRGIPLSQVYALTSQGFTLPPKSTYFYPKVPSGLTINPLA